MNWHKGDIAQAVTESRKKNAIFVVFITGNDEASRRMQHMIEDRRIRKQLESEHFVAIRIESGTLAYIQFTSIYQMAPVPSIFFIGNSGIPIEIGTAVMNTTDELKAKIKQALKIHLPTTSASNASFASTAARSQESINQTDLLLQQVSRSSTIDGKKSLTDEKIMCNDKVRNDESRETIIEMEENYETSLAVETIVAATLADSHSADLNVSLGNQKRSVAGEDDPSLSVRQDFNDIKISSSGQQTSFSSFFESQDEGNYSADAEKSEEQCESKEKICVASFACEIIVPATLAVGSPKRLEDSGISLSSAEEEYQTAKEAESRKKNEDKLMIWQQQELAAVNSKAQTSQVVGDDVMCPTKSCISCKGQVSTVATDILSDEGEVCIKKSKKSITFEDEFESEDENNESAGAGERFAAACDTADNQTQPKSFNEPFACALNRQNTEKKFSEIKPTTSNVEQQQEQYAQSQNPVMHDEEDSLEGVVMESEDENVNAKSEEVVKIEVQAAIIKTAVSASTSMTRGNQAHGQEMTCPHKNTKKIEELTEVEQENYEVEIAGSPALAPFGIQTQPVNLDENLADAPKRSKAGTEENDVDLATNLDTQLPQKWKREKEMKDIQNNVRRVRAEEQLARERIRALIAADRAEQAHRSTTPVFLMETRAKIPPPPPPPPTANIVRLQFRLLNGELKTKTFAKQDTIATVRDYVSYELLPSAVPREITLCTVYPRYEFSAEDDKKSLVSLGLFPSAVILVIIKESAKPTGIVGNSNGIVGIFRSFVWVLMAPFYSVFNFLREFFFGSGRGTDSKPNEDSQTQVDDAQSHLSYPLTAGPSTSRNAGFSLSTPNENIDQKMQHYWGAASNMHRLNDRLKDSDDENATYNGNSTQQQ